MFLNTFDKLIENPAKNVSLYIDSTGEWLRNVRIIEYNDTTIRFLHSKIKKKKKLLVIEELQRVCYIEDISQIEFLAGTKTNNHKVNCKKLAKMLDYSLPSKEEEEGNKS